MAASALLRIGSEKQLAHAWHAMFHGTRIGNRKGFGVDGESLLMVHAQADHILRNIGDRVRSGKYTFSKLKPVLIPKTNGKDRAICVPTVRDRIVQRALLQDLSVTHKKLLTNPVSYGFVRGRNVLDAVKRAKLLRAAHPWVYKTDITKFFDTVQRDLLSHAIRKHVRTSSLHQILIAASQCEIEIRSSKEASRIAGAGIKSGVGVRQGMPLSPFFANILLSDFDKAVVTRGLRMVRYADDLIFLCDSKDECEEVHAFCVTELKKHALDVPPIFPTTKTIIFEPKESAEFLGVLLVKNGSDYSVEVGDIQVNKIKEKFFQLSSLDQLANRKVGITRLGQILNGMVAGYVGAYEFCENIGQLETALVAWRKKVIERIFRDGFGLPIPSLTADQRAFLELDKL
jgi:group II intron reverse transcriptase/maturase